MPGNKHKRRTTAASRGHENKNSDADETTGSNATSPKANAAGAAAPLKSKGGAVTVVPTKPEEDPTVIREESNFWFVWWDPCGLFCYLFVSHQ